MKKKLLPVFLSLVFVVTIAFYYYFYKSTLMQAGVSSVSEIDVLMESERQNVAVSKCGIAVGEIDVVNKNNSPYFLIKRIDAGVVLSYVDQLKKGGTDTEMTMAGKYPFFIDSDSDSDDYFYECVGESKNARTGSGLPG